MLTDNNQKPIRQTWLEKHRQPTQDKPKRYSRSVDNRLTQQYGRGRHNAIAPVHIRRR
jgi:hypothetical protein